MALRALLRSQDLLSCSALQLSDRAIARLPTATILLRACQTLLHSHQGTDSLRPAHCSMAHSQARQLSSSSASGSTESPAGPVKVAVGQMTAVGDQERNFEVVSHLCQVGPQVRAQQAALPQPSRRARRPESTGPHPSSEGAHCQAKLHILIKTRKDTLQLGANK